MAGYEEFAIIEGDAQQELAKLSDGDVQLFVSSPPYNIRKPYERDGFPGLGEYKRWMEVTVALLWDKLNSSGSVCWQVGNHIQGGTITPLDYLFFDIFSHAGFKLRNRIIWTFNFGLHAKTRFSGRYETLLWFTKSEEYTFNLDAVRVPQIYPGKRHSSRKGKSGPSGNPLGKNPSDYWEFDGKATFVDDPIWKIPNVKANHPEKTDHPCQFPSEVAERCILAFSDAHQLVVDPFAGTGVVPIAARALGRCGLGIELKPEYAQLARGRAWALESGDARLRPSGNPVRQPLSGERVAQLPPEWMQEAAE